MKYLVIAAIIREVVYKMEKNIPVDFKCFETFGVTEDYNPDLTERERYNMLWYAEQLVAEYTTCLTDPGQIWRVRKMIKMLDMYVPVADVPSIRKARLLMFSVA